MDTQQQAPRTTAQPPKNWRTEPPRLTGADIRARGRIRVTLTTAELEQLAQLIRAGHALVNDGKSVSPQLRAAMTRLGISTHGL